MGQMPPVRFDVLLRCVAWPTLNPTSGRLPSVPPAGQPPNGAWRDFVLARHAEDLRLVFERLTADRYGHLFPSLEAALTDRLDATYAEAVARWADRR